MFRCRVPGLGLATALTVLSCAAAPAAADRTFEQRYARNITGDVTIVGNTLMTCPATALTCAAAQAGSDLVPRTDNDYSMVAVDQDGPGGGANSSRATLNL